MENIKPNEQTSIYKENKTVKQLRKEHRASSDNSLESQRETKREAGSSAEDYVRSFFKHFGYNESTPSEIQRIVEYREKLGEAEKLIKTIKDSIDDDYKKKKDTHDKIEQTYHNDLKNIIQDKEKFK